MKLVGTLIFMIMLGSMIGTVIGDSMVSYITVRDAERCQTAGGAQVVRRICFDAEGRMVRTK